MTDHQSCSAASVDARQNRLARDIESAWSVEPAPFNRADVAARVVLQFLDLAQAAPEHHAVADLPLYWQGRCNTLRILLRHRGTPDTYTETQADTYEECAKELKAALASQPPAAPVEAHVNSTIPCYKGGFECNWPACAADCDGRPGVPRLSADTEDVVARLRKILGPISGETQPLMKEAADLIEHLGAQPQPAPDTIGGDCAHRIAVTPRNGAPHGAGFACGITGGHCVARPGCGYEPASPVSRPTLGGES